MISHVNGSSEPRPDSEVVRLFHAAGLFTPVIAARELALTLDTASRYFSGSRRPGRAILEQVERRVLSRGPGEDDFTFIDLFAGIGGMRKGFEAAGGRCVFTSEWDRFAQETYRANFGDDELHGDIKAVPAGAIPHHDVLVAGFPCQPFSIAGVSKKNALGRPHGFACETQGTLFFDVARILEHHRPCAFLLENVSNLLRHDRGRTFEVILKVLREELGYAVSYRILNAQGLVPQHRKRVFIAGVRADVEFDFDAVDLPEARDGPTLSSILHPEDGSEEPEHPFTESGGIVASKYVLSRHLWDYLRAYKAKHAGKGNGFGYGLVGPEDVARTLSARYFKDGSEILVRRGKNGRARPRRLTPRECARLMGFDGPESPRWSIPVSDPGLQAVW